MRFLKYLQEIYMSFAYAHAHICVFNKDALESA